MQRSRSRSAPRTRRRRRLAIAFALAATQATVASSALAAAPAAADGLAGIQLNAVSAVSADDVWAVGSDADADTAILHWDGSGWTRVSAAAADPTADLWGITAVSADDIWAVGDGADPYHPLIEHWDGSTWTLAATPRLSGPPSLQNVAAVSPTDVWAVGSALHGDRSPGIGIVCLHWNGRHWTQVATPKVPGSFQQLISVSGPASDDVWAVGFTDISGAQTPISLHWDGTAWSRVKTPVPTHGIEQTGTLTAVTTGASGVWAVGTMFSDGNASTPFSLHWSGSRWQVVRTPDVPHQRGAGLLSVAGSGPDDVWAVGYQAGQRSLTEHWDGTGWVAVDAPDPQGTLLAGVAVVSRTDVWAVGSTNRQGASPPLLDWNGHRWSQTGG